MNDVRKETSCCNQASVGKSKELGFITKFIRQGLRSCSVVEVALGVKIRNGCCCKGLGGEGLAAVLICNDNWVSERTLAQMRCCLNFGCYSLSDWYRWAEDNCIDPFL